MDFTSSIREERRFLAIVLALSGIFGFAAIGRASSIIETEGRLEVNWSNLHIRFYGEASSGAFQDDMKSAEKRAWQDGLSYVTDAARDLHISANEAFVDDPNKLAEQAREAALQISKSTFSYNTTYYGDGTVRVHLENALPKALESSSIRFRQKEAAQTGVIQNSGIVIQADRAMKPRATYKVVDENGAVLFDVHDMAEEAYRKNLMGRWFRKPSQSELSDVVGKSPLTIPVRVQDGRFVATKAEWESATSGVRSLLVNGQIAVVLP